MCRGDKFLPREDRDAAELLIEQLEADGCSFAFNATLNRIQLLEAGNLAEDKLAKMKLTITQAGEPRDLEIDAILFAAGRVPNVRGMGLEEAGVEFSDRDGIYANHKM